MTRTQLGRPVGASGEETRQRIIVATMRCVANVGYSATELFGTGNNHPDAITAGYTAAAVIGALRRRERTGRGAFVDVSIHEAGASFIAEIGTNL